MREVVAGMSIAVLLSFGGCVNTDSSSSANDTADINQTDPGSDDNTTDSEDDNTTDQTDDPTQDYSDCEPNEDQENSNFDTGCAELDSKACLQEGVYGTPIRDTFFTQQGESDSEYGVEIRSKVGSQNMDTVVFLYYPVDFSTADALQLTGNGDTIKTELYDFSFDTGWAQSTENTMYVRTPPLDSTNGYRACYRYTIDATDASDIEAQKVYRLNE